MKIAIKTSSFYSREENPPITQKAHSPHTRILTPLLIRTMTTCVLTKNQKRSNTLLRSPAHKL